MYRQKLQQKFCAVFGLLLVLLAWAPMAAAEENLLDGLLSSLAVFLGLETDLGDGYSPGGLTSEAGPVPSPGGFTEEAGPGYSPGGLELPTNEAGPNFSPGG